MKDLTWAEGLELKLKVIALNPYYTLNPKP